MAITLSQACAGFIHYQTAAGRSPYTLRNYRTSFAKLHAYVGDPELASITRARLVDFFVWLREDYVSEPAGVAPRPAGHLAPKTILNIHADLSALWRWACEEEFIPANIVRSIEPPDPTVTVVEPFTQAELEALIAVCDRKRTWKRAGSADFSSIADRDRCILLLLVDTGLRASELCNLRIADLDMGRNQITVRRGKGDKDRYVHFGKRAAKAIWRYLTPRLPTDPADHLIVVGPRGDERPMDRRALGLQLARIGERAGVPNVYPHRFRHTFAITCLRNGMDLFTLQELLGHTDLAMVRRYARIAQADCARAHAKASPADNWRLG